MKTNFHQELFKPYFAYILITMILITACSSNQPTLLHSPEPINTTTVITPATNPSFISIIPTGTNISSPVPNTKISNSNQGTGGTISFPNTNQAINGLALDDQYVYFSIGPNDILRQPLDQTQPYHPQVFARIQYPDPATDGAMRVMPRLLKDHWLYYVDSGDGVITDRWTLRAKNTVTLAEKVITQGNGCFFGFSVDGDRIAVNFSTRSNSGPNDGCGENILEAIQISSGQTHILDRTQIAADFWVDTSLSGDRLAANQLISDQTGRLRTVLFDLKTGHSDILSDAWQPSAPVNCANRLALSGQWFACNISETETFIYNLSMHQTFSLSESFPSDSEIFRPGVKLQDHWLYWTGSSKGDIYDLAQNKLVSIATPGTNMLICDMVLDGEYVAWTTLGPDGYVLKWEKIPYN